VSFVPPLDPQDIERVFGMFRLSRVIFAAAQLGIADLLVSGPRSVADLASATSTHAPTLGSLLEVLHGWGVFERQANGSYALTPVSRRLVAGTEGGANVPFLLGWAGLPAIYEAFGGLGETLRGGENAFRARHGSDFYEHLAAHPDEAQLYERAMESTADGFAASAAAYDFSRFSTIVDVGGGQGACARAILERHPSVSAVCFDLPQVVAHAPPHAFGARLRFVGGDMFVALPAGADAYFTSTVLRCFDDERCVELLRSVRAAMRPDSVLLAAEMLVPAARDHALMSMADLTARLLYGGCDRTQDEFAGLFARAGLSYVRSIPVHGTLAILEAKTDADYTS